MNSSLNKFLFKIGACPELSRLIIDIARASKYVAHAIRTGDLGKAGTSNLYGEDQLALDVLSDKIFCETLAESDLVSSFASEEQDGAVEIRGNFGKFSVAFDPLDGSSLVDTNGPVGSIFGVWKGNGFLGKTGEEMPVAGFFLYGPRITLILSLHGSVNEFTLNDIGEYHLSQKNITIDPEAKIFAAGNLRATSERPEYKAVLDHFLDTQKTLRYAGGMVPDINTILLKRNGIFTYPSHSAYPDGKLRLLYECAPMAHIVTAAGGSAVSESGVPILSMPCRTLHERTSIIIGSSEEVETVIQIMGQ